MNFNEKYIDCLNNDFQATKREIARRSNLQKAALAGFVGLLSIAFSKVLTDNQTLELIVGLWLGCFIVQIFIYRQSREIERLGKVITYRISEDLSQMFAIDKAHVYHSQTNNEDPQETELKRLTKQGLTISFNLTLYFLLPLFLTINFLAQIEFQLSCPQWLFLSVPAIISGILVAFHWDRAP